MGFRSNLGNALEYGANDPFANNRNDPSRQVYGNRNERQAQARGLGMPADSRGLGYVDEGRRGHFIPTAARGQEQPVRMNREQDRGRRDIGPT